VPVRVGDRDQEPDRALAVGGRCARDSDFIADLRAFGPSLRPNLAIWPTLPPTNDHSTIEPSAPLASSFIDEWGFTSLNALKVPVTFASFPKAYTPARE
jgi:hypothetical protein